MTRSGARAPRAVSFGQDAQTSLREVLSRAARLVGPTLGPLGRTILAGRPDGPPVVLSTGLDVLKRLDPAEPIQGTAARLLRDATQRLADSVGDGTATAVLLAEALYTGARAAQGERLAAEIARDAERAVKEIERLAFPVRTLRDLGGIAASASGGEPQVSEVLSGVLDRLASGAAVVVEESRAIRSSAKATTGFQLPYGAASGHLTDSSGARELVNPLVLVSEAPVQDVGALARLLEKAKTLLLFAPEIDADCIATLVVNRIRGTADVCAIRVPDVELLEDLAAFSGAVVIRAGPGPALDGVALDYLGGCGRAVVGGAVATLLEGRGDVRARADALERRLSQDLPLVERDRLLERRGRLGGSVVRILAGGASPQEAQRNRDLIRCATKALGAAIRTGAVPGAQTAYLRAAGALPGDSVVRKALLAPAAQLARNSRIEPAGLLQRLSADQNLRSGLDSESGRIVDVVRSGIIDPLDVVRQALRTASSLALTFLGCEAIVSEPGSRHFAIPPNILEAYGASRR